VLMVIACRACGCDRGSAKRPTPSTTGWGRWRRYHEASLSQPRWGRCSSASRNGLSMSAWSGTLRAPLIANWPTAATGDNLSSA